MSLQPSTFIEPPAVRLHVRRPSDVRSGVRRLVFESFCQKAGLRIPVATGDEALELSVACVHSALMTLSEAVGIAGLKDALLSTSHLAHNHEVQQAAMLAQEQL